MNKLDYFQTTNETKCKLIETSVNVLNEIDHRMPVYWPCLTMFCQAISTCVTDINVSNILTEVCEPLRLFTVLLHNNLYIL